MFVDDGAESMSMVVVMGGDGFGEEPFHLRHCGQKR